jgi:hypothetical protein
MTNITIDGVNVDTLKKGVSYYKELGEDSGVYEELMFIEINEKGEPDFYREKENGLMKSAIDKSVKTLKLTSERVIEDSDELKDARDRKRFPINLPTLKQLKMGRGLKDKDRYAHITPIKYGGSPKLMRKKIRIMRQSQNLSLYINNFKPPKSMRKRMRKMMQTARKKRLLLKKSNKAIKKQ